MTLIPVTILVPEDFLAQLIANGVKVQALPDKGKKYKKSSAKKPVTQHHTLTSSSSSKKTTFPSQQNRFLGGKTPSDLFELSQHPPKPSHRRHLVISEPCHRPGYPTASQLLAIAAHPPKVGKKVFYPAEKENLTSSKLVLAHKKASGRPELFHGLTASQLLVQNERQNLRSSNYKKYMSARLYPTSSQLFLLAKGDNTSKPLPKTPSEQKPNIVKKRQQPTGKKEQMIQRITPKTEPRSLLEPTPSLLLLKHLSLIPSIGSEQKQKQQQHKGGKKPVVVKQKSQKEMERNEMRLEPLLYGF